MWAHESLVWGPSSLPMSLGHLWILQTHRQSQPPGNIAHSEATKRHTLPYLYIKQESLELARKFDIEDHNQSRHSSEEED